LPRTKMQESALGPAAWLADPADPWDVLQNEPVAKREPTIRLGGALPLIARSLSCPGEKAISKAQHRLWNLEDEGDFDPSAKEPKIYVLMIPGAADSVTSGWARMEYDSPSYFEFATFEWASHGVRAEERHPRSIREVGADAFETFRDAIIRGSFILCGHSIGSLIATYVCIRAERELGRTPLAVFHIDRPPPHYPVWSEYGFEKIVNHPEEWMALYQPSIHKAVQEKLYAGVEETLSMWANDEKLNNCIMPLGSYKFPCRVFVFIAMEQFLWNLEGFMANLAPEDRGGVEELMRFRESGSLYSWKFEWFKEWEDWGDQVTFNKINTDHMNIKNHNCFLAVLYRVVKDIIKRAELRAERDGQRGGS